MKMKLGRKIALMLAAVLLIPVVLYQNTAVASAATPAFSKKSVTIVGQAKTYQMKIKNTVSRSKYKWSTSDVNIVKVTSKGLVTAVNKGTATIKCKITYPSRKSKIISCKVTVTIPVQTVKINNANEVNGAHKLLVGQSYKFTYEITPANTSDTVIWSAEGDNKDCIKVDADGTVTGVKVGKTILTVTAGTGKAAVSDEKIIEVAQPTAAVKSIDFVDSNTMKVVFDSAVDSSTVIGSNSKILGNISISLKRNSKNVMASDPGTLKGTLSADLMTLTITSANMFNGDYSISLSGIKTTSGIAIGDITKQISYIDSVGPSIVSYTLDDSGFINNITFSEAVSVIGLQAYITGTSTSAGASATPDPSTKTYLTTATNYILSEDKKTLSINLAKISSVDYGKVFSVTLYGVRDLAGNYSSPITLPVTLRTDNSAKPQAKALSVTRSGYYTITALFDRAISFPGYATVNGTPVSAAVDANDSKKVNYTLPETLAALTGTQNVILSSWSGYNASTGYAGTQNFTVNFTVDKTVPELQTNTYDSDTGILTLTYNKDVSITAANYNFAASYQPSAGVIKPSVVPYTQIASTDRKIIKLKLSLPQLGNYTLTLNAGFVKDDYKNSSMVRTVNISNADGTTTELPGPYSITQSPTNPSQIILEFANMLDINSAQTVSNYLISGVNILSAQVTKNTPDTGATVVLNVADGSINLTVPRPVVIKGIRDYNGAYAPISNFVSTVTLKENNKATLLNTTFDAASRRTICLNFSEPIQGSVSLNVAQINLATPVSYANSVTVSGSSVYITLGSTPPSGAVLSINILLNNITDLNGNFVAVTTPITVSVGY